MEDNGPKRHEFYQNIVVMRHGDRIDNFDPLWISTALRPWDPPLVDAGRVRVLCTGRNLQSRLGFPIHRVFVSPFLRCVQTAVSTLRAFEDGPVDHVVATDRSKVKVSIEYGLCEMLNTKAFRHNMAPKDGNFSFNISELQALLPAGTVDRTVKPVYQEMPKWEETVADSRARYEQVLKALADKYPSENLLLVTHGEGVHVSISAFMKDVKVNKVEYCAYSELRRPVLKEDQTYVTGEFEVLTKSGQTGIRYCSLVSTANALNDVA